MSGVGIAVGVGVVVGGTGVLVGDGSAVAVDRSGLRVGAGAGIVGAALANSTLASIVASAARSSLSLAWTVASISGRG